MRAPSHWPFGDDRAARLPLLAATAALLSTEAPRVVGIIALGMFVGWMVEQVSLRLPAWKAADMVPMGILCFALLLDRGGMAPPSIALILVSSLGLNEFKPAEIVVNTVMLGILGVELTVSLGR